MFIRLLHQSDFAESDLFGFFGNKLVTNVNFHRKIVEVLFAPSGWHPQVRIVDGEGNADDVFSFFQHNFFINRQYRQAIKTGTRTYFRRSFGGGVNLYLVVGYGFVFRY